MKIGLKRLAFSIASAGLLSLYGCGDSSDGVGTPVANTTTVPVTVIDGPIKNAKVCLDKNKNGACDTGEPFALTTADGKANLVVDAVDAGKFPVLAVVGTDATDADTGAVPTPFTLSAPADAVGVVSPLTTLVQQLVASTGASTADAAAAVKAATGISASLFEDFTTPAAKTTAAASTSPNPAIVARMVVVTTQQQSSAIASAKGTLAADGVVITQTQLDQAVQKKLMELLPTLVAALSDPAVTAAAGNPAGLELALKAAAGTLLTNAGLTPASIATVVAINTASVSAPVASAPSAGFSLTNLNFTDASNYFHRVFSSSLAQNTPDASNNTKFVERRARSSAGSLARWGTGGDPWRQSDLHWNGSAWANCPINFENTSSPRDALGNSAYDYCGGRETGKSTQAAFDIAGKTMAEIYAQVRTAGYTNLNITDPTVLGTTTFPAGSSLRYQTSTPITMAISYYPGGSNPPGESNLVTQYSSAVSNGGVASTQAAGVGCNALEFKNTNGTNSTTLEGMIGSMTGTPCVFGQGQFTYNTVKYTSPDASDEAWGQSTAGIGVQGSAPVNSGATAPGYYSGNTKFRVAFKGVGANAATYYQCKEKFNSGGTRNCVVIGTGTYTITTLGDARVMTLNNLPAQTSVLNFTRVFVERKGVVYQGYQNKPNVSNSARLNAAAATALLGQLGLIADDPSVPLALTAGSYQGTWDLHDPLQTTGITVFMNANGSVSCQDTGGTVIAGCVGTIADPATGAFAYSDANGTASGNFSALLGTASGTYNTLLPVPSTGSFVGQRR